MGRVYRAHDPRLDRQVAIKLLPPETAADHAARERLRLEAMAVAALDHPYICKIFEIGEYDAALCLVMEYVPGDTLERRLKAGRLPLAEALAVAGEVAEALEEAHARRFLHRDLKPANIMLTPRGHVKVMDFGLAKRVEDLPPPDQATVAVTQLTVHGTIVGTPDYMSPEQVKGLALDPRSDLFSFGVILAEMIGGRHPFRRPSMAETLSAVLREPPELGEEIPQNVMPLVRRLLAKNPEDRYASAADVRADLSRLASREPVATAPVVPSAPSASWRKQIGWAAFAIGLTVAGYLAVKA
jgi:serine/threonine protein kinase